MERCRTPTSIGIARGRHASRRRGLRRRLPRQTLSPMGDNVTRDPLPAASPVRRPHGRLAPRAGLSGGAQRHRARVVHAAGGPLAARVPRPPRRHAHARRLPRPGDGVGDHAAAGAPPQGRRGHLLQRHRGAAEARRRRRRDPARSRSRLRPRVCGCRGRRRADGHRPRAPRRGIRAHHRGGAAHDRRAEHAPTTARAPPTPLIGFAGAPFTLAAYLAEGGPSKDHLAARTLMHADPGAWRALMEWTAELTGRFLRTQVLAGASAAQLFDSWAGALSLADYETHVAPASAKALAHVHDLEYETTDAAGAAVTRAVPVVHFGVGTGELLGAMHGIGVDTVGVDYRVPLDVAAQRVGADVPLQGNLDPALLAAPWPVLEAAVRDVLAPRHGGAGARLQPRPRRAARDRPHRADPRGRARARGGRMSDAARPSDPAERRRGRGRRSSRRRAPHRRRRRGRRRRRRARRRARVREGRPAGDACSSAATRSADASAASSSTDSRSTAAPSRSRPAAARSPSSSSSSASPTTSPTPNPAGAWLVMPGTRRPARRRAPAAHGHARHPREPARRRRAPHHRLERGVARLPRPAQADPQDRPRPQPRAGSCDRAWATPCSTGSSRPISAGVYSANPDDLDLDVVAPGLNEAMTRMGSLSGGVGQLLEERKAGTAVLGLRGGMHRLVDALARPARPLRRRGRDAAPRSPGSRADAVERRDDADAAPEPGWRLDAAIGGRRPTTRPASLAVDAPYVVLAAPADASRRLLDAALARLVGCLGLAARGIRGARDARARRARARRRPARHRRARRRRHARASRRRRSRTRPRSGRGSRSSRAAATSCASPTAARASRTRSTGAPTPRSAALALADASRAARHAARRRRRCAPRAGAPGATRCRRRPSASATACAPSRTCSPPSPASRRPARGSPARGSRRSIPHAIEAAHRIRHLAVSPATSHSRNGILSRATPLRDLARGLRWKTSLW